MRSKPKNFPTRTGLSGLRSRAAPIAGATLFFFFESALAPAMAWAHSAAAEAETHEVKREAQATEPAPDPSVGTPDPTSTGTGNTSADSAPAVASTSPGAASSKAQKADARTDKREAPPPAADPLPPLNQSDALPTGGDKSGVTSKAISLPQGSGKIQGMDESFSAQLSTGIATFSVPFSLLPARGGAQPALGLSYSSSGGFGLAGVGWDVGVPFIARQTDRGLPSYDDRASFHPNQDRFVFNGGQELVPLGLVIGGACAGAPGETMPPWGEGSQYFRPRVEGSFLRFFWSADHKTWRVQDKSGVTMELGVPLDGTGDTTGLDVNPSAPDQVYRWHLVRQYDTQGSANPAHPLDSPQPNNVVLYRYLQDGGMAYLTDIYDTTPAASPTTTSVVLFAHHTRLNYEQRSDPTFSFRSGWRMDQTLRLVGVDVSSKTFNGATTDARHQVRRYHLAYEAGQHASLLASVQVEGRCAGDEASAQAEVSGPPDRGAPPNRATEGLPDTSCDTLPAMTFGYSHVSGSNANLPGYEAFNEDLHTMASSPAHSINDENTDLLDINSDGLPDVLNTQTGHNVFFNSPGGKADSFGAATPMSVQGVMGETATVIAFNNSNVVSLDLDGDGTINLLHMPQSELLPPAPQQQQYSLYSPFFANGAWSWLGRAITPASRLNPKIDLTNQAANTKVMDVNGDGFVDVVVSTGTEFQTFFSLGRLPQGDGRLGNGSWASATTGALSDKPVEACVPWSATPVSLSDSQIQINDMNGDGFPDIVRVRPDGIIYWPGRGDGTWGTGLRSDCTAGTFSSNGFITMASPPKFTDVQQTTLRFDDVNGDGLDDLVQINANAVEIWLNVDGKGYTESPHIIKNTPQIPLYDQLVRLVDMNGSGTRGILWGIGRGYQYIDLQGGTKPWLLTHVENGLGKSTEIEYSTSTAEMLAAESLAKCDPVSDPQGYALNPWGCAWTMKMPTVAHVVKRVTESDNLSIAGQGPGNYVTEYQYRDPLFEGRQREFRGFTRARSKRIGDANSPTDFTDSAFLLGECEDETPSNGIDECAVSERWRDNPREALKGLPIFTEKYSETGVYQSTDSSTYRLRQLFVGLDGRAVRQAFESDKKTVLYDTAAAPQPGATATNVTSVYLETAPPDASWSPVDNQSLHPGTLAPGAHFVASRVSAVPTRVSANTAAITSSSEVDFAGNKLVGLDFGCSSGDACPKAESDGSLIADETIAHVTKAALLPSNPTGWLWRTTESWVVGSVHQTKRGDSKVSYDAFGNPLTTTADLGDVVQLDRLNTGSVPLPTGASANLTTITVSTNTYNALGLLTQESGANGRCRDVSYGTDAYGQLATSETIHTSGGCTGPTLTTGASYDRGLGAPTQVIDMQGQPTNVSYDYFGRLSALFRPSPSTDGVASPVASVLVSYTLPSLANPLKYSVIHTKTQDGASVSDASYLESFSYVDGMGRTIVSLSEADKNANDLGAWIASGFQSYDAKSAVARKYLPFFFDGDPTAFPVTSAPTSSPPYGRQRYDAFGRQLQTFDLDGTVTLQSLYHALSTDLSDAADLEDGPHQGSYASTRSDGHSRTVATTERTHVNGAIEAREVRTQYLPSGEPEVITRVHVGKTDAPVVRWMKYDTLGHLVLNVDPNTTQNFNKSPSADSTPGTSGLKAWRYAYNDAGDLVGTSDARGCGENFTYDGAGRLLSEDYIPCGQPTPYSLPAAGTGSGPTGYEVLYRYDSAPAQPFTDTTLIARPPNYATTNSNYLKGRLVAVWSRGKTEWTSYDGRGRVVQTAILPALPVNTTTHIAPNLLTQRYGTKWYYRDFTFDGADREVSTTTGSTVAQLQGTPLTPGGPKSAVTTTYSDRGTVKKVGSTYGDLVTSITRSADGLVSTIVYGDAAGTTTASDYDARRRLRDVQTYRGPPNIWNSPPANYTPAPTPNAAPSTFQLVLQDQQISYDVVGNPTEIHDYRTPEEWPAGAKPLTKKIQYDDLYRATRVDYQAAGGTDSWTSPFAPEVAGQTDPRRAKPGTHVSFTSRPLYQTFNYDWLGNTQASDDDAHGFYDRSLGTITNDTAGGHPYQLSSANNKSGPTTTRSGSFAAIYDATGNLLRANLERNGPCLPTSAPCSSRFQYSWDEVGRLTRAFRVDAAFSTLPALTTDASTLAGTKTNLDYLYDESDERIVKTYTPPAGAASSTLYPYETLEVRGTALVAGSNPLTTSLTADNEVPYLVAHGVRLARLVFEEAPKGEPRVSRSVAGLHVLFELGDQLGSTNIVIDKDSSELVEAETYQGYGAKESDYRPDRWKGYREDYGFTGKEEDIEFGVVYFGKRFYSPYLNRWLSADPLAVHAPGEADLNLYAYVSGAVLKSIDPLGLDDASDARQQQQLKSLDRGDTPGPTGDVIPAPPGTKFVQTPEVKIVGHTSSPAPKQFQPNDPGSAFVAAVWNVALRLTTAIHDDFTQTGRTGTTENGDEVRVESEWSESVHQDFDIAPPSADASATTRKFGRLGTQLAKLAAILGPAHAGPAGAALADSEGPVAAGALAEDGGTALSSNAARRQVMRDQGIPTSQQPISQDKNASGRSYEYEVPRPGGGTQVKSVQQQTLDSSHAGQGHWEAGKVKTDPLTGQVRQTKHGRPKLTNDKSKANYK